MSFNLSEGALGEIIGKAAEGLTPILQVLGSKKINSGSNSEKDRYRLLLSDGKYTISFAILTTQISEGGIAANTVVKVKKYVTSVINNNKTSAKDSRVLLILDLDVIKHGDEVGEKIGNPVPFSDDLLKSESSKTNGSSNGYGNGASTSVPNNMNASHNGTSNDLNLSGQLTHPISSLSPYQNRWIIKVRVTNKGAIRTWSNSRGEGKLFSCDLLDDTGEIRFTAFKDSVDKFYDYLQVDKVYFISKCQVKAANKQFSSLKNDYELSCTNDTIIQECQEEDTGIPQTKYDFVTIDKVAQCEVNKILDVIGVCKSVSELQTFQAKSTGRELKKKEVVLVDQSNTAVTLTLWGSEAESFDGTNNPVVVIKGARVGEFQGSKSISTLSGSLIKFNPDLPEAYRIRAWYDSNGASADFSNISKTGTGTFSTPWVSFRDVKEKGLGSGDKGDYYQTMGTILLMKGENCVYKACPAQDCNKKVVDLENGMYRCEKCNREYPNFKYRLLVSMNVGDYSGNQWLTTFSTEAEKILGLTSQEVGETIDANPNSITDITDRVNFKQFVFKCRAKMEAYNDEVRLKTVAVAVNNINYTEYNAHIIERINALK